ncbi:MAG TPA: PHP domain-containing protein, partial [Vicinamibacterales bacterium]
MYIELHAASAFSFLQGASLPETLVERAAALGYPALALLDADGVYGAPRFHKAAEKAGLKAIIGAELTIESHREAAPRSRSDRPTGAEGAGPTGSKSPPHQWRLPVLVANAEGYRNLCRLVTRMKMRAAKGEGALELHEFEGATTGLVALAGRPILNVRQHGLGGLLDRLIALFGHGNVCVELQRHLLRDEES